MFHVDINFILNYIFFIIFIYNIIVYIISFFFFLRVHKLNKLYVIDASIMPSMPSGNTNAAVAMIAEKGADLIKRDCYEKTKKCKITELFHSKQY